MFQALLAKLVFYCKLVERTGQPISWKDWSHMGKILDGAACSTAITDAETHSTPEAMQQQLTKQASTAYRYYSIILTSIPKSKGACQRQL
jgi:hypothetical protein